MAHVEAGAPAFGAQVITVLRIVRVPQAGEDARSVVNGLAIGVSAEQPQTERQPPLQARLEAVVIGARASTLQCDLAEERIRGQVGLLRAGLRLIDVARGQQLCSLRSDIS